MPFYRLLAGGIFLLSHLTTTTLAVNATAISSVGCVNSGAFDSCVNAASNALTVCLKEAKSNNLADIFCINTSLESEINCYLSHCWNKVYSCEYQRISNALAPSVVLAKGAIPFWPAPDDAPGGCSCNIGKLTQNFTSAVVQRTTICDRSRLTASNLLACRCCTWAAAFASYYSYCPTTDPNVIKLPEALDTLHAFEVVKSCANAYSASNCEAQFGLAPPAGGQILSVDSLPSWTGTNPLSTMTGSVTSPPGGATMTWTAINHQFTVTADPYRASRKNSARGRVNRAKASWMVAAAMLLL